MSWRVHLALGRVSNLPTVWTNVLAGALLAGGPVPASTFAALLASLSCSYVGGMYLNDAFDAGFDARTRPERPIPSGRIARGRVYAIGFTLLGTGLLLLLVPARSGPGLAPVAAGVGLAAVVTYYDATHKRDPLSPLVMGLCRVLTYAIAALAVAGRLPLPVVAGAAVLLCYLIGLTYVAKQETLAEVRNLWPLLFLAAPFVYTAPVLARSTAGAVIWVAFLGWVLHAISFLVRPGRVDIPRAVIGFIAGISLLDALLVAHAGAPAMAGWGVAGFALTLVGQRWVKGT